MHTHEGATLDVHDTLEVLRRPGADQPGMARLLDEAIANPALLRRLAADVVGTLHDLGVQVPTAELKELLGIAGATDLELFEVLRARISHIQGADCGCGGSED